MGNGGCLHDMLLPGSTSTVKPPNKGHFGDGPVVPCREVVLFLEVFFKPIGNFLKMKTNP